MRHEANLARAVDSWRNVSHPRLSVMMMSVQCLDAHWSSSSVSPGREDHSSSSLALASLRDANCNSGSGLDLGPWRPWWLSNVPGMGT